MKLLQPRHVILLVCLVVLLVFGASCAMLRNALHGGEALQGDHAVVAVIDQVLPPEYRDSCVQITRLGIDSLEYSVSQNLHGVATLTTIAQSFHEDGSCAQRARNVDIVYYSITSDLSFTAADLATSLKAIRPYNPDLVVLPLSLNAEDEEVARSVETLLEDGALIYASAGNTFGLSAQFPASMPGVIAVGALDSAGNPMKESARKGVDRWYCGEEADSPAGSDSQPVRGISIAVAVAAQDELSSWLNN